MTAVERYVEAIERMVQQELNIWRDDGAAHIAELLRLALCEGTHALHDLNKLAWGVYAKYELDIGIDGKVYRKHGGHDDPVAF